MLFHFNKKPALAIIAALAIGAVLAALILRGAKPGDPHGDGDAAHNDGKAAQEEAAQPPKGPHGGKLFADGAYGLEVTIFEQGAEPQMRLYTYLDGKAQDPASSQVKVNLARLGRPLEELVFKKEDDYLKSTAAVAEPHSFKVAITAQHADRTHRFQYEQIEARVTMSARQVSENGVDIHTAGPARIKSALHLIGEIRTNEDRAAHIVARLAGVVESIAVNAGDRVRKGQVLAVLSSSSLADQRSQLLAAQRRLALAQTTFAREQTLWQEKITAEQDYLQARVVMHEAEIAVQNAQQKLAAIGAGAGSAANLARHEIRAPIDGTVIEKSVAIGETLKEDTAMFVLADLATVWADMTVPVQDLNVVKTGQKTTIRATAFDAEATGTVTYIGAVVGEQTRNATARIVLPNPKGVWRPGLPVTIELVADEVEVPIAVLADAIQSLRDWQVVFGRYGDYFEARPLTLGRSDGRYTEVLGGLNAGEKYAAKNSFLIKADLGKAGASHDH